MTVGPHEGIPHKLINDALDEMIEIVTNNPRYIHPLIKSILVHYFIAYVHPFFDGNGRTARALFYFKSIRNELKYIKLFSVSAYLKEHGNLYEKSFVKVVANEFDITYFIDFCLDSMCSAFKQVSRKVLYLLEIPNLQKSIGLSNSQIELLQRLALQKFRGIDIEEYARQIDMSRESARRELKALVDLDLLSEMRVSKKYVYRINSERLKKLISEI